MRASVERSNNTPMAVAQGKTVSRIIPRAKIIKYITIRKPLQANAFEAKKSQSGLPVNQGKMSGNISLYCDTLLVTLH